MELFQIDYFRALARTGNMTAAASELHITQPALSRAISALETDLDTQLFERERGKLYLNRAGELFLENADKIFAEIGNARERLEALKKPEAETLRFGTTQHGLITRALYEFCAERPELHVEEERLSAREIKNYCETSSADFVFSPESAHSPVIEVWKLYTDGFVLLGGKNGTEIPVEEIRDMRIIQFENYHRLDAVYASPNFSGNLCFDCGDAALALGLVRSGFGVTVLSRDYYRFLSESSPGMTEGINCAVVTKNGLPLTYDVLCSRQRYREMSAAAGDFADFLRLFYAD